jgi:hypothetical protein
MAHHRRARKGAGNGNFGACALDFNTRNGIRRALSAGLLGAVANFGATMGERPGTGQRDDETFLRVDLGAMALLAWLAVLSGAYIVYPWYRAIAPLGSNAASGIPTSAAPIKPGDECGTPSAWSGRSTLCG